MTDSERYGLPGLLSMIPLESPDYSSLAVGQDLTVLGLDLSRPEYAFHSHYVKAPAYHLVIHLYTQLLVHHLWNQM